MSALTSAELAAMRTAINETLPDVCNILSVTRVSDGEGGFTETWGTASTSVACRLDAQTSRGVTIGSNESVQSGSLKPYSSWVITLPHGTSISATNRVEVGSNTYSVIEPDNGKSWAASVRAILEKL